MKKPLNNINDEECRKMKSDLLRRKVKRISPGKGKHVSELIIEMRY
jgi:hypothetical protein